MKKRSPRLKPLLALTIVCILLVNVLISVGAADKNSEYAKGFDKGPSYTSVVPLKKTTFINYDEQSYLDDYAYLAAIPTAVFRDNDKLFSHPLLFYQDKQTSDDEKKLPLNARVGIDYFMEDWMGYCNGLLDQMTLINVKRDEIKWIAKNYVEIDADNPYSIACEIALQDWSWSNNAVIAVIDEEFDEEYVNISESITGTIEDNNPVIVENFKIEQTNKPDPAFNEFDVCEDYSFIKAEAWWDGILVGGTMIPSGDPDIQLYFKQDEGWVQTSASSYWNICMSPGYEYTQSHVYIPGTWKVGVSDIPIKNMPPREGKPGLFEIQGSLLNALLPGITYNVIITKYPGETIEIPDDPPFGCKEADFKLTWNNKDICLGFSIIGPGGEAIYTMIDESRTDSQEIHFESLGECLPGENYSISVFSLNDVKNPVGFQIEYTFKQGLPKQRSHSLTSAVEGAILASQLNAPLLYTSPSKLSETTKDSLYKLGVKNVFLVNIGNHVDENVKNEIENIASIKENYIDLKTIYDSIREITGSNDVIFSTVDPWSYWYLENLKPIGEKEYALHVGPAAFIASHHGSPVIIIDNHPRLSSAVVWHNEFWRRYVNDRCFHRPSTAEMVLTGKRIYDFLDEYGFDKKGKETIITVADQYDIGVSWDRIFPGVANSGRFCGSPVDEAYWISRNIFYPALVFENPALNGKVELENGSSSKRINGFHVASIKNFLSTKEPLLTFDVNTLKIQESEKNKFEFPVLCSFVSYTHRFNERASKYYGTKYTCADGIKPGCDQTNELIDQGSIYEYTGKEGSYFPDMTESEIVPFYLQKGGYGCAFSTSMSPVVDNLNDGVIMWIHSSHGSEKNGGIASFWKPDEGFKHQIKYPIAFILNSQRWIVDELSNRPFVKFLNKLPFGGLSYYSKAMFYGFEPIAGVFKEKNPWRGYEWYTGSTREPDTMSIDMKGTIPFTSFQFPLMPATGMDWTTTSKPMKNLLNKVIPLIDPFDVNNMNDGVIGTIDRSNFQLNEYKATEIERNIENLHSVGFITTMCQTSNTYFHLMLIRHGSAFQVQNPWPSSIYSTVWQQSIPRDIALGYSVGEAYSRGVSHVGNLYLGGAGDNDDPQWWWDTAQSVVYFGDPNLRVYVPGTNYGDENNWGQPKSLEKRKDISFNGHMPFGAPSYPRGRQPSTLLERILPMLLLIAFLLVLIIIVVVYCRRKGGKIN